MLHPPRQLWFASKGCVFLNFSSFPTHSQSKKGPQDRPQIPTQLLDKHLNGTALPLGCHHLLSGWKVHQREFPGALHSVLGPLPGGHHKPDNHHAQGGGTFGVLDQSDTGMSEFPNSGETSSHGQEGSHAHIHSLRSEVPQSSLPFPVPSCKSAIIFCPMGLNLLMSFRKGKKEDRDHGQALVSQLKQADG